MITGNKVRLREKRLSDALKDHAWQTNSELAQLDATPLLTIPFPQYLLDYAYELRYSPSNRHRFAIEALDGKHIGNCGYYNLNEVNAEAELGIMIGDREYWDKGYGTDVVSTMLGYIFRQTNLARIYLKTLTSNKRAQKCFQKCGFTPYGQLAKDGFDFVLMETHRKQWQEQQDGTLNRITHSENSASSKSRE